MKKWPYVFQNLKWYIYPWLVNKLSCYPESIFIPLGHWGGSQGGRVMVVLQYKVMTAFVWGSINLVILW